GDGLARREHRSDGEAGGLEREDAVQVDVEAPEQDVRLALQTTGVLGLDQLPDGRATIACDPWWAAANHVKQHAVEKQEAIVLAGDLTFDQEPVVEAPGAEPRAYQVRARPHAAADARAAALAGRLHDARRRAAGQELLRGREVRALELEVL